MRLNLPYAAFGLALAIGAPAAHAQTVITTQPAPAVIAQPPMVLQRETIQTIQTVRTVRAAPMPPMRRQIVTTRTVTRRVMPAAPAVVAGTVAAAPQPLYDSLYDFAPAAVATPAADMYPAPGYGYSRGYPAPGYGYSTAPLYDVAPAVAPAPVYGYSAPPVYDVAPAVAAPVATQPVIYRYVYEPDRILVIDPITGIAVQAIPR
jgi:hypothetical protein